MKKKKGGQKSLSTFYTYTYDTFQQMNTKNADITVKPSDLYFLCRSLRHGIFPSDNDVAKIYISNPQLISSMLVFSYKKYTSHQYSKSII